MTTTQEDQSFHEVQKHLFECILPTTCCQTCFKVYGEMRPIGLMIARREAHDARELEKHLLATAPRRSHPYHRHSLVGG